MFQLVKTRQFQTRSQPLQEPKGTDGAEDGGESRGDDLAGAALLGVLGLVGVFGHVIARADAFVDVVAVGALAVAVLLLRIHKSS